MKLLYIVTLGIIFSLCASSSFAQTAPSDSPCQTMEIHCKCENPTKDFIIPKQKVGKTNPTDPGKCWPARDITNLLNNSPMVYCMRDDSYQKDPSKPQTKCTATWTCKETCDLNTATTNKQTKY